MHRGRSDYSSDEDSEEYNKTLESDSFQSRDHINILYLMSLIRNDVNPTGMCHGFALTALHYYNKGKLDEYDELIGNLLKIYHASFDHDAETRETYLKEQLQKLDEQQKIQGKISIEKLFKHVVEYQKNQEITAVVVNDRMTFSQAIDGIYNQQEIGDYLYSLHQVYLGQPQNPDEPFSLSLILSSSQHTLLIVFEGEQILVRDINYPDKQYLEGIDQIFALALNQSDADSLLVSTSFFIPQGTNHSLALHCLDEWQKTPEYEAIHELTDERLSRVGKDGNSLLSHAILTKQIELAKNILDSLSEDVDQAIFARALFIAILENQDEIIDVLLKHPLIDINLPAVSDAHGYSLSPLCTSILYGNNMLSEKLLSLDVDPNADNNIRLSLIEHHKAIQPKIIELTTLFDESTDNSSKKIIKKLTPLHFAALLGNDVMVNSLLGKGAKISMCDGGLCADDLAICMGYQAIADTILDQCKKAGLNELMILNINNEFSESETTLIQETINKQARARDCLSIMSCIKNIAHLANAMNVDPIITELFSDQLKQLHLSLQEHLKQNDNNETMIKLNQDIINIIHTLDDVQSIGANNQPDPNEFSEQRQAAIARIKSAVANNEINNIDLINEAIAKIDQLANIIQKKESGQFMRQTVHQDWKALVGACYDQIGSKAQSDYTQIRNKISTALRHHNENPGTGLTKELPIRLRPSLTEPFENPTPSKFTMK